MEEDTWQPDGHEGQPARSGGIRFAAARPASAVAHLKWLIAPGLAALLVWPAHAWAGQVNATPSPANSPDTHCRNAKLRAVDNYTSCLIRVLTGKGDAHRHDTFEEAIARCDEAFNQAFGRAEDARRLSHPRRRLDHTRSFPRRLT
jgi:hypothetical protein